MATMAQAIVRAQDPNNRDATLIIQRQTVPQPTLSTREWSCSKCQDKGYYSPKIGDVLLVGEANMRVEITERNRTSYSLNCDQCANKRLDKQRVKYQSMSMLTETECGYRLGGIVTKGRADTAAMVQACLEMVCGQASMLTFWGSSGNAKSVALIATVNEFLDRDVPAIYVPSYDLLNWVQDAFSNQGRDIKNESAYDRLEMFKRVQVLAVDELQGIKITDWRLEQLRNLIDYRWRTGMDGTKYTLFAMNESPDGLEPRIYSRLRDGRNRANGQDAVLLNEDKDMRPLLRSKA